MPGTGLIATLQAFVAGPVAYFLAAWGIIKFGGAMLSGEHRGHGAGAAMIGVSLCLWCLRFVSFVQSQS